MPVVKLGERGEILEMKFFTEEEVKGLIRAGR